MDEKEDEISGQKRDWCGRILYSRRAIMYESVIIEKLAPNQSRSEELQAIGGQLWEIMSGKSEGNESEIRIEDCCKINCV